MNMHTEGSPVLRPRGAGETLFGAINAKKLVNA